MNNPRDISPGSIMPAFPWLLTKEMDIQSVSAKIAAMMTLGVPYPVGYDKVAPQDLKTQAKLIATQLVAEGVTDVKESAEIIALIAYLQRLGTDIKAK